MKTILKLFIFVILSTSLSANVSNERFSLGSKDAPVVMYEFVSLACVHCATFSAEVFPQIKKNYVDKGLLRVVYMDVPFGGQSVIFAHSLLYQTKNAEDFFKLSAVLLKSQSDWMQAKDPIDSISKYAKLSGIGITDNQINVAKSNTALHKWLQEGAKTSLDKLGIRGTPSLVLVKKGEDLFSKGIKLEGFKKYKVIQAEIDKLLK